MSVNGQNGNHPILPKSPLDTNIGEALKNTQSSPQETEGERLLRLHKQFPHMKLHEVHDLIIDASR